MLFAKRVDAIVIDVNIFKHLLAEKLSDNESNNIFKQKVVFHYLFKKSRYAAGFKSKVDRDQFNQGITKIKKDGSYQQIIDSYITAKPL